MFYDAYDAYDAYDEYDAFDDYYMRQENSYVRLLHASPNSPAVDVYANGNAIARNLTYRQFTPYLTLPAGRYSIRVFPAGQTANPVLATDIDIAGRSILTAAVVGILPGISLFVNPDPVIPKQPGRVLLRFTHLSPNAPNVDVALQDGTRLFSNVGYRQTGSYVPLRPGVYIFRIFPAGTQQTVLYVPNIRLRPNRFYTIYAIGLAGGTPPLQVLIPLDGNSYINV